MDTPINTSSGPWSLAFASWCGGVSAFQAALALGLPWGAAAWGGRHSGVLPARLRLASAVAAPLLAGVGAVGVGRLSSGRVRRRVLMGTAAYAGVGVVMNGASPSPVERAIWTPRSAVGAVLAVGAWREAAREAPSGRAE